ncbi:DUF2520 domain-containing protein [Derxia gummosa]|uniref:DUF2520 domain-containing protein n=1 Tax=Derxia gummosa DSM 723 TaxID=1121388 RepID=A0A8B6X8M7_9BURK|nr:DUF2520 domain-containing protein [Derxia gummosa]
MTQPFPAAPAIAFIGAGRLASSLARAFAGAGARVVAIASRDPASAAALAARIDGCRALAPQAAADAADLVFITVPDDAIASVADALRWRAGQGVVHCSGATELTALDTATRAGALAGGFHPLQIFSDPDVAIGQLAGAAVAIEAPAALAAPLDALAAGVGLRPFALPPGARARYHASAGMAASFLLTLLDEAARVWASFGVPPAQALAALLPIARGTLAAAESRGLAGAVSGPPSRGDVGVIARHLAALDALDAEAARRGAAAAHAAGGAVSPPAEHATADGATTNLALASADLAREHGAFYRELTRRQLALVADAGRVPPEGIAAMHARLAEPPRG